MKKFIPSYQDHLARYVFALEYCYKKRVLDCGSQIGFGAWLLSLGAEHLTLSDLDERMLDKSKKQNFDSPTEFVKCDFNKEFPEGKWDTITAFEVIEHVEDPEFLVKNISEHLKDGGILVFSVPHMVANRQHKTLFDEQSIKKLISKHLVITEFYIQDKKIYSERPLYKGLKCYLGVCTTKNILKK
jgi:2-polyprenyl-3-methyl-5-hydroxy-6-metoxy-1,4-benzoquinol methylase